MPRILTPADIAQFRDRTCAAAAELFVEVGYSKFTMRDLAKRLGASAMTPYRYFRNRGAILALVKAKGFSMLACRLEAAIRDVDGTINEKSEALVRSYVRFAGDESSFYRLMFQDDWAGTVSCSELDREEQRVRKLFVEYAGLLSEHDADVYSLGEMVWSMLHGAAIFRLTRRSVVSDDVVVEAITAALTAEPRSTRTRMGRVLRPSGKPIQQNSVPAQ